MIRSAIAVLIFFVACFTASAAEMQFTLVEHDMRPQFDLFQFIWADGEITRGTKQRFADFLAKHPSIVAGATVMLNSPGGSVGEAMELGDIVREKRLRTDVGRSASEEKTLPGQCMSACIYMYLGGEYRYLHTGSEIGVHRFFHAGKAEDEDLKAGQIVSGARRMRSVSCHASSSRNSRSLRTTFTAKNGNSPATHA